MWFIGETLIRLYCGARDEKAQTMAEYALILSMASIAAVALLLLLGPQVVEFFTRVTGIFDVA